MIRNYIKIALRDMMKNKGLSFINVFGMAVGIASCIVILMWINNEYNYNRHHENYDHIYRIITENNTPNSTILQRNTPFALSDHVSNDIPEAEQSMRTVHFTTVLKYKEKSFTDDEIALCDPSAFDIFSLKLTQGDPNTALHEKFSIILSEETSKKIFGDENPMGKTILYSGKYDLKVTGVLAQMPHNSTWDVDCIVPLSLFSNVVTKSWKFSFATTYVLLRPNINPQEISNKLSEISKKYNPDSKNTYALISLFDDHIYGIQGDGVFQYLFIFASIALCILIIACINFANLTTAKAENRMVEIGLRKVTGARRIDLVYQFYSESLLFTIVSTFFALAIVHSFLPEFNLITGKQLSLNLWDKKEVISGIIAVVLITALLSGSYPALLLSSFRPAFILRRGFHGGKYKSSLRKVLVIIQFSISIFLIIGTIVISNQLNYIKEKDLGYDKNHIFYFSAVEGFKNRFDELRQQMMTYPTIVNMARSSSLPNYTEKGSIDIEWQGKDPDQNILMHPFSVDYYFLETYSMKIITGRSFSSKYKSETAEFLLNEAAVKSIGKTTTEIIGENFSFEGIAGQIIGVVKDFNHSALRHSIEPLVVKYEPGFIVSLKIKPENLSKTIKYIKSVWLKNVQNYPFEYDFFDDVLNEQYETERMVQTVVNYFTVIALILSSLGILGLISFVTTKRSKEIAIRKVLGANEYYLAYTLTNDFIKLALIGSLIGWVFAWFIFNDWLEKFAYRINIGIEVFIISTLLALLLTAILVIYQTTTTARANPVKFLKYE